MLELAVVAYIALSVCTMAMILAFIQRYGKEHRWW